MKIRIMFLIPHLQNQGPVMQLLSLVRHLDLKEFEPIIVTLFPEQSNSLENCFAELGITIISNNIMRWQVSLKKSIIETIIEQEKPDIIHSCSIVTDSICVSIKCNRPLVITLHNYIYEDVVPKYGRIIGGYFCNKEKKAIKKAQCVIPCSVSLYEQYQKIIPRDYYPIPNGIDIEEWKDDSESSYIELRKRLNLPLSAFIIISTGTLIQRKNPLTIIEAFKEANIMNAVLVMAGDGDLMGECMKMSNKNIIFTGRVGNVKDYLYASDLMISASSAEGLPYAVLEAECTGIKMMLSRIPQHQEAVRNNKKNVRFFSVDNRREIEAIMKEEAMLGRKRVNYLLDDISSLKMAKRYMKVYRELFTKLKSNIE